MSHALRVVSALGYVPRDLDTIYARLGCTEVNDRAKVRQVLGLGVRKGLLARHGGSYSLATKPCEGPCGLVKPVADFGLRNNGGTVMVQPWCKRCRSKHGHPGTKPRKDGPGPVQLPLPYVGLRLKVTDDLEMLIRTPLPPRRTRRGEKKHCSRCGGDNHNRRTCDKE